MTLHKILRARRPYHALLLQHSQPFLRIRYLPRKLHRLMRPSLFIKTAIVLLKVIKNQRLIFQGINMVFRLISLLLRDMSNRDILAS